jgi:hypothetical protein
MCNGKKRYADYAAALTVLFEKGGRPELASCYQCDGCGGWHISSKHFTLVKPRGRGGARRRLVSK